MNVGLKKALRRFGNGSKIGGLIFVVEQNTQITLKHKTISILDITL